MAKVLVADDSAFMRKILVGILNEAGHTDIIEATDGKEAIEKFASEKPDITLLDIIMPVSGIEALKEIIKKDAKAKVIMITAIGQEGIIKEVKELGAVNYIIKPFRKEQVVLAVKLALA